VSSVRPTPAAAPAGGRIQVLPPHVAEQIAAGEVVERPASVVKELVENALDAGARQVRVELEDAGLGVIAVIDDGEGIGADDAPRAFARHATSKVRSVDDLFRIRTLGFRGEALASIGAVSTTTLTTRQAADLSGTQVVVRGGTIVEQRIVGSPAGTRVEVVDLFGNVPARRKFLKAPATEVGHVSELLTRTALAWPQVGFTLRHGTRVLVEYAAVADAAERVAQVFGRERAAAMLAFECRGATGRIHGWLTNPQVSFPSARQIFTYVNGRFVRDKLVSHALVAGYSTLLMHGRYPAVAVFIEVSPEEVDVNVHPAKSEVRFRRGGAVHDLITRAVHDRLRAYRPPLPEADPAAAAALDAPAPALQFGFGVRPPAVPWRPDATLAAAGEAPGGSWAVLHPRPDAAGTVPSLAAAAAPAGVATPADAAAAGFFGRLRVLGQAFEGYLVCESGDALLVIDQHAAHERVMFERLRRAYATGGVARQRLLVPVVVDVGPAAAALLEEAASDVAQLGFELDGFGGTTVAVRAVPALLGDSDPAALVRDLAEELTEVGRSRRVAQAAEAVLARLACHSAVRVGQTLGGAQIQALLAAMDGIDLATNCPHGRPAFITLPRSDLERLFRRT